jgi:hypothetical protein
MLRRGSHHQRGGAVARSAIAGMADDIELQNLDPKVRTGDRIL